MKKNNTFGDYFLIFIMLTIMILLIAHLGDEKTKKLEKFQDLNWDYIIKPFK